MELEFDKEIDAILRKAREPVSVRAVSPGGSHVDADAIAAFVENALPEKAKLQYTAHCVTGTGNARVYAYVTGDSINSAIFLTYKVNLTAACPNSVIEPAPMSLKVYPNPVRSSFVVSGLENAGNLLFKVYDMKGAVVKSEIKDASASKIEISLQNLPEGNYMLKAFDSHGKVFGTSRLSKVE